MNTGENNTTWGTVTNLNLGTAIEQAIAGSNIVSFTGGNTQTLTASNSNSSQPYRNMRLVLTDATAAATLVLPMAAKLYFISSQYSYPTTVSMAGGSVSLTIPANGNMVVYCDGTLGILDAITYLSSLSLGSPLPIASGGTGANTSAAALTAIGAPSLTGTGASGSWGISVTGTAANITGVAAVANGGTSLNTSPSNGQLLIGNGTGYNLATLTAGTGISVTNSAGGISIAATGTQVYPAAGIAVSSGSAWGTSLTAPSGTIVGTSDTQTLTNKTLSGGVVTAANINADNVLVNTGTISAASPGFRGIPQNAQTTAYTLALTDQGEHISITTGGVTIPANGSVAFPIGATVVVFNNSASNQTIAITTDTLRQAGTANTGTRTLAQYGLATLVKVAATTWAISGAGVS